MLISTVGQTIEKPIYNMADIFDLEAIMRSDHKTDIKYEFLDPKKTQKAYADQHFRLNH